MSYLFAPQLGRKLQPRPVLKTCHHSREKKETIPPRWKKSINHVSQDNWLKENVEYTKEFSQWFTNVFFLTVA